MKIIISLVCVLFALNIQAKSVEVMSYNVENLFDAKHDEGKNDWSFLPKDAPGKSEACAKEKSKFRRSECYEANWTDEKVEMKISQIVDVITKERKSLPDFLGLVEVENGEVVGRLAKKLGYENIEITSSPDFRGVDVALLYKTTNAIKKISRSEHEVPVDYPSRNILEVEFMVDGHPLTIFVNHWPSLANPDSWRIKAAEVLSKRTKELLLKNPKMGIMAVGDFNTIDSNDPHPFKTVLFKDNLYTDAVLAFKEDKNISDTAKKKLPEGSYYFPPKDQWNYLDHIFYTSSLKDGTSGLSVDLASFEVYLPSFALKEIKRKAGTEDESNVAIKMVPNRFNSEAKSKAEMGFSDHFAVVVKLTYPDLIPVKEVKKSRPVKAKNK